MRWNLFIPAYWKRRIEADKIRWTSVINEQRNTEKERNEKQKQERCREIASSLQKIADSCNTYSDDSHSENNYRRAWERKRFRLDVAGVVVAGLAAAFLLWQQHTMQGQLNQMQADDRPWVSVEPAISGLTWDNEGMHFVVRYNLVNTGKSPAFKVSIDDHDALFTESHPIKWMDERLTNIDNTSSDKPSFGFPIFPNQTYPITIKHIISRKRIENERAALRTFKHSSSDPDGPLIPDANFVITINVGYIILYKDSGGNRDLRYTYCWMQIGRPNPTDPFGIIDIRFNEDAPQLRANMEAVVCGAK
jgi:hypothetical protein